MKKKEIYILISIILIAVLGIIGLNIAKNKKQQRRMSQLQKQLQHLVQNLVLMQILLVFQQKSQLESGWVLYIMEK